MNQIAGWESLVVSIPLCSGASMRAGKLCRARAYEHSLRQVTPVKDKSVSFYVALAKRALLVNQRLELSGIGTAMATTVNIR